MVEVSEAAWAALQARTPWPGVYAVISTGIFCRAGCPARTPLRRNVRIYPDAEAARAAGFRACKRCRVKGEAAESRLPGSDP